MAKGRLVYTQHTVAFPTQPAHPADASRYDSVGISDEHPGGGTHGEFYIEFVRFSNKHTGVQLNIFGDGMGTFYDRAVQRAIKKWARMKDPDAATPEQIIDLFEREGVVPSSYHKREH